jgi:hypothetical protein
VATSPPPRPGNTLFSLLKVHQPLHSSIVRGATAFQTESAIGLQKMEPSLARSAGALVLDWPIFARLKLVYYDDFYRRSDSEYTDIRGIFDTLKFAEPIAEQGKRRIAQAIRISAAFSAWYAVSAVLLDLGWWLALLIGTAAAIALSVHSGLLSHEWSTAAWHCTVAIAVVGAALSACRSFANTWPSARKSVSVLLVVSTLTLWAALEDHVPLVPVVPLGVLDPLAISLWLLFFTGCAAQALNAYATRAKAQSFPEHEVVETLAWLVVQLAQSQPNGWQARAKRRELDMQLQWLTYIFETGFEKSFDASGYKDDQLAAVAAQIAAAFRERRVDLAFPSRLQIVQLDAFIRSSLRNAAMGEWASLNRSSNVPSPQTKLRERFLQFGKAALTIAIPLCVAIAV